MNRITTVLSTYSPGIAFQMKSRRGIATPRQELDMIRRRLQEARRLAEERDR